ncbi:30S ribosomal protein S12 methylthiotransferase RimO [bacterium]|nr:30S ribosomal protein S12 methylthiotransferase RimO [bacterium]
MNDIEKTQTHKPNVAIVTLGCVKNTVDSEIMLGQFIKNGFQISLDPQSADVIVINTCGFIEDAKKESIDVILDAIELRKTNPDVKIFVTGCLSQRYYKSLIKEFPEIDGFLGVENFHQIVDFIKDENRNSEKWAPKGTGSFLYDHTTPRVISTPGYMAYTKIAEGCSHSCSFCAIPAIKGPFKSREMDSIIAEANDHAKNNVKELTIIAQDTSYWGRDLNSKPHLADLLEELDKINELEWIRLLYLHPDEIDDRLLETIASAKRIVNYIDIPLQHVNPRILKDMGRGYKTDFRELIGKIRNIFDGDVAIRTTFLVGYPGETDYDFDEILDFLEDAKLDRVTAFVYSDEEGTKAYEHKDKLDTEIGRLRYERLMDIQRDISFFNNEKFIGKKLKVLVESSLKDEGKIMIVGRSYRDAPEVDGNVIFRGSNNMPGEFVNVTITDVNDYDLIGEIDE